MELNGDKQVRVGVRELRGNLSGYLRQARHGTSVLVVSRGEVVAEIRPPAAALRPARTPGALKGRIRMAPDFDAADLALLAALEGDEE